MRGALSRALREAAVDAGVRFEFGKVLESVAEREGGVVARFADGSTTSGRALVGADGIHSRTRGSFFPDAPPPTYTGIINLGGVVRTELPPILAQRRTNDSVDVRLPVRLGSAGRSWALASD